MTQQTPKRSTNKKMDKMVLQDSRSHADNQLLFWAKDAKGYTTDINQAHLFTQGEAMSQQAARTTDIPHKLADIRAVISATVDRDALRAHQNSHKVDQNAGPKTAPQVWAYQSTDRSDERPLITTSRALALPDGWSELDVTSAATSSALSAAKLHEWSDDFAEAAKLAPTPLQATILRTRSEEAREAATALQARQALDSEIQTLARQSAIQGDAKTQELATLVPPETLMHWSKTFDHAAKASVDDARKNVLQSCAHDCHDVASMLAAGQTVNTRAQDVYSGNGPIPAPITSERLTVWAQEFEKAAGQALTGERFSELDRCAQDCHERALEVGHINQNNDDPDLSDDAPGL